MVKQAMQCVSVGPNPCSFRPIEVLCLLLVSTGYITVTRFCKLCYDLLIEVHFAQYLVPNMLCYVTALQKNQELGYILHELDI